MASRAALFSLALTLSIATASADPFRPSMAEQMKLGKQAADQIRKENKVLPDSDPRVIEMRRLGAKLVAGIPEKERTAKPFQYTFDVLDSKELNAFALPGGPIFLNSGLLDKLKYEDEAAGIIGHELTHIRNQHWASAYADNLKRKLGITVIFMVVGANNDILNAADMLDDIVNSLPYSRKHETESDKIGYDLMAAVGYNPKGLASAFQVLLDNSKGQKVEEWMSTHPDTKKRIEAINQRITKEGKTYPAMRARKNPTVSLTWSQGWATLVSPQNQVPAVLTGGRQQ